jgi:hypothetical protein
LLIGGVVGAIGGLLAGQRASSATSAVGPHGFGPPPTT